MPRYLLHRILSALAVLLVVLCGTFALMKLLPGSPYNSERIPAEVLENLNAELGLNDPWPAQFVKLAGGLLSGELSSYYYRGRKVRAIIRESFPKSALLGLWSIGLSLLLGVPLGILAALKQNRWPDHAALAAGIVGVSVPSFILATLLVYWVGIRWALLPVAQWGGLRHQILPSLALAGFSLAFILRLTRASMLEVLRLDFMRTARAKGLGQGRVLFKHGLRNALLPVVTYLGPLAAGVLTGSFVIEKIFNINGLGEFFVTSISNRDYPMIFGVTAFYCLLLVGLNLLVDLFYLLLDPRITFDKD